MRAQYARGVDGKTKNAGERERARGGAISVNGLRESVRARVSEGMDGQRKSARGNRGRFGGYG